MSFKELVDYWGDVGRDDPLWGVLTDSEKKENRWNEAEFYGSGQTEIETLLQGLDRLAVKVVFQRALDFGCGAGRLSLGLSERFQRVDGVDISEGMLVRAKARGAASPHCHFHLNQTTSLELFASGSFDLVVSIITLQHMKPALSQRYLAEFSRVLKPGGALVFQIPSELDPLVPENVPVLHPKKSVARRVYKFCRRVVMLDWKPKPKPPLAMEMHGTVIPTVLACLAEHGLRVVSMVRDDKCGPRWLSYTYIAQKIGA